jgi:hypothetical protein
MKATNTVQTFELHEYRRSALGAGKPLWQVAEDRRCANIARRREAQRVAVNIAAMTSLRYAFKQYEKDL